MQGRGNRVSCRKVIIHVEGHGDLEACIGDNLGLTLASRGLMPLPCGGRGLCGLCRIRVSGRANPPTIYERLHGVGGGERLACQVRVEGELWVSVPRRVELKTSIYSLNVPPRHRSPIMSPLSEDHLVELSSEILLPKPLGKYRPTLFLDKPVLTRGDPSRALLVDLGTTKTALQVVDDKGSVLWEKIVYTPLQEYGSDIITRLTAILDHPGLGLEMSHRLRRMLSEHASKHDVGLILAAGNTVMTHILHSLPVEGLAAKPFKPYLRSPVVSSIDGRLLATAPMIGGFVGGDAYSELIATITLDPPKPYMVIDLGTNTEIILVTEERMIALSTPAGPAFEGHLSRGSSIELGGVTKVRLKGFRENGEPVFKTEYIGRPTGLLGTGLISAVAELHRAGIIDDTGRIVKGYRRIRGVKTIMIDEENNITLTQLDVREFQKALAAVRTGWRIALRKTGIEPGGLKMVFVAGSFGSSIDPGDLVDLALTPTKDREGIVYAGNLVLTGLRIMYMDRDAWEMHRVLLDRIEHVNPAEEKDYMKLWIESLSLKLPETSV